MKTPFLILLCIGSFIFSSFAQNGYDKIEYFDEYREGWALVQKGNHYGFIDRNGHEVVKPVYDKIDVFGEYKENWALVKVNGKYGFIDNKGNEVVKTQYDQIDYFGEYKENWAMIKVNGKYGFIDKDGHEVVKPIYDTIAFFGEKHEQWAEVKRNRQYLFIDNKGKEVLKYFLLVTAGQLSSILRDMKEHTSKVIIKEIKENQQESRKEWLLEKFKNGQLGYRVWQQGNHPIALYSDKFIEQKERNIHMNPVEAGIVSQPQHYRLSSASQKSPIKVISLR